MEDYLYTHLANGALLRTLDTELANESSSAARVIGCIAAVDARRLYADEAYDSMYAYCLSRLHLSEDKAFKCIRAARTARRYPAVFEMLADNRLNPSGLLLLAPYLKPQNAEELLAACVHKSNAQIDLLLAERFPKPDVPALARAVAPAPGEVELAARPAEPSPELAARPVEPGPEPAARPVVTSPELAARPVEMLLGLPTGDYAQLVERAFAALAREARARKFAATARPRKPSRRAQRDTRHIPASVQRYVWRRDGGQCTFTSAKGHRCAARSRLELDHVVPVARGGQNTSGNLRLRCRAHNQLEAEREFGAKFMEHKREQARERATVLMNKQPSAQATPRLRPSQAAGSWKSPG